MSAQPRATIRPSDANYDVERHAFLDAVVALDDMVEHRVDRIRFGFGEESDAAQIDAQHRDLDIAGELRRAQEGPVTAEDEDELTALGRAFIGVDDLDIDAEGPHVVGRQVHRPAVHRFRGQHTQTNAVVAEHLFHPARGLGGLVAPGVHYQQDRAFSHHCGPSTTARSTARSSSLTRQRMVGPGAQVQKVFDVPRRTGQWAGRDVDGVPVQFGGPACDGENGARAQLWIGYDPACADTILADLELWFHHGNDIGVVRRA